MEQVNGFKRYRVLVDWSFLFFFFNLLKIILIGIGAGSVFVQKDCSMALLIDSHFELSFSFVFLCIL